MTAGWFLPALFVAGRTEALARKLPFVLRYTLWERAPLLVLALAAFLLADRWPALTLAVLLAMLAVMAGVGGALVPAWMDIVGRAIPTTLRGRFFAVSSTLGNTAGFAGSFATAWILGAAPAPAGYGICFLAATFFMACSYAALALVREPADGPASAGTPLRRYLAGMPGLLRENPNLSWFLLARASSQVGMMATGFYTVYALRIFAAPASQVGVFTAVLLAGQVAGNLALGWLADRAGHRLVIIAGVAATLAANLVALGASSLDAFRLVFALAGVQVAALHVSSFNVLLEFAPSVREQPTYVGLGNTALTPVVFAAPLAAGTLADTVGFGTLFLAAAVFGAVGLGLLLFRVRDPRREAARRA